MSGRSRNAKPTSAGKDDLVTDNDVQQLVAVAAMVTAAALAYGKVLGPVQTQLVQWFIDAFAVPSQWRGLMNLAVGIAVSVSLSLVVYQSTGRVSFLGVGVLAGLIASVEAAKVHDETPGPPAAA
jgi:hypothetical protein